MCKNNGFKNNAGERIRTFEGTKPIGPKPIPFDRSGTPAQWKNKQLSLFKFFKEDILPVIHRCRFARCLGSQRPEYI